MTDVPAIERGTMAASITADLARPATGWDVADRAPPSRRPGDSFHREGQLAMPTVRGIRRIHVFDPDGAIAMVHCQTQTQRVRQLAICPPFGTQAGFRCGCVNISGSAFVVTEKLPHSCPNKCLSDPHDQSPQIL